MDQANTLRRIVRQHQREQAATPSAAGPRRPPSSAPPAAARRPRVIAVSSGKGGVGKTNTVLNLSLALCQRQRRVLLLDADMGLANVDVLLGLTPRYTLEHVLSGQRALADVVLQGPLGLRILPSASGIAELSDPTAAQQKRLFAELRRLDEEVDYLFIDTGAGISPSVLRFNAAASEVYLVVSPEPTSMTDAYALMKLLAVNYHVREFGLIANSVLSEQDGRGVFERLSRVVGQFLGARLTYLGGVPLDRHVPKAVRQQRALLDIFPNAPAARSLARIAAVVEQGGLFQHGRAPTAPPSAPAIPGSAPLPGSRIGPPPGPERAAFWDRLLHWTQGRTAK